MEREASIDIERLFEPGAESALRCIFLCFTQQMWRALQLC